MLIMEPCCSKQVSFTWAETRGRTNSSAVRGGDRGEWSGRRPASGDRGHSEEREQLGQCDTGKGHHVSKEA